MCLGEEEGRIMEKMMEMLLLFIFGFVFMKKECSFLTDYDMFLAASCNPLTATGLDF